MKHLHKSSGLEFECGELMEHSRDIQADGIRKTYDMTVITLWSGDDESPIIVGYYFGDYDEETTDYYIDQWLQKQAMENEWLKIVHDCKCIVNAYWITNEDVLVDNEYGDNRSRVQRTLTNLNRILEVIKK